MASLLEKRFGEMGAELLVENVPETRFRSTRFAIDVRSEIFVIEGTDLKKEEIKVLDVQPDERHLLLMWKNKDSGEKHKYLCGHDERHWFVAAVPGESVKNVTDAMEALKPQAVIRRERATKVSSKGKRDRHNAARRRQGEWFFVPAWHRLQVNSMMIHKKEPIQRGRAKPHICEEIYRVGGEPVWVCTQYPNGITDREYKRMMRKDPSMKRHRWRRMVRDARVYARGKVSHPDHATLDLGRVWHEVIMNRENEAPGMRNMRFLD